MSQWTANRLVNLFRRETSGGGFLQEIDGLRFFPIASVLVFHLQHLILQRNPLASPSGSSALWLSRVADQGWFGVPLFFVISGFILGLPFARHRLLGAKKVVLKQYFLRRVTRIEPPYVINILFFAALLLVVKHPPISYLGPRLLATLFYVHNLIYHEGSAINYVAWTLEIEVQFYLLAPILTLVFCIGSMPRRRILLAITILAFGLLRSFLPGDIRHGWNLIYHMQYFVAGFLLAEIYLLDWSLPSRRPRLWDLAAVGGWVVLLAALMFSDHPQRGQLLHVVAPWLVLLIYCAAFRGGVWKAIVRSTPIFLIGGMCYTIYLWHPIVESVLSRIIITHPIGANFAFNWVFQEALMIVLIIPICAILYLAFEKPFMKRNWPTEWLAFLRGRSLPASAEALSVKT